MFVDKTEHKKIVDLEDQIDIAWNMISELRSNGGKSFITGHDVNCDFERIETYLKAASQKTQELKSAYENELKK